MSTGRQSLTARPEWRALETHQRTLRDVHLRTLFANDPGRGERLTAEAAVAIAEGYTERAKKRMVRLTRRFGGVNSTVMVPTDYPVQPGDTIYVLERFF